MVTKKGPLEKELDRLGLNKPESETPEESAARLKQKRDIARDFDAPDPDARKYAREREDSAVATLVASVAARSLDGKRGGDMGNQKYALHEKWAVDHAKIEWYEKGSDLRPGEMADLIRTHFRDGMAGKEIPRSPLPPQSTITGWIKTHVPEHLQRKPGRRRKP